MATSSVKAHWTRREIAAGPSLVLHADDFGMNRAITDGIVHGFREGLLTSTSVLANAPDAARALSLWRKLETERAARVLPSSANRRWLREPDAPFDLGIHLNLTQGRPLTGKRFPKELLRDGGQFAGIGRLFRAFHRRRVRLEESVRVELSAQIRFLQDHGHSPTHLNGHQYIEMLPGLAEPIRELLADWKISSLRVASERALFQTVLLRGRPANWCLAQVKRFYAGLFAERTRHWGMRTCDTYFGTSHAGGIDLPLMETFLTAICPDESVEVGLHPGMSVQRGTGTSTMDKGWHDPLARRRPRELAMLTSPSLFELLRSEGVRLGRLAPATALADEPAA